MAYRLEEDERRVMMHALGLAVQKRSYRNHYIALRGSAEEVWWDGLEVRGLAVTEDAGPNHKLCRVTDKGIKALGVDDRVNRENRVPDPALA